MQNITVLLALILVGLALSALALTMKALVDLLRMAAIRQDSILSSLKSLPRRRGNRR